MSTILKDPTEGVKRPKLPRRLPVYLTPPEAAYRHRSPRIGLRDWALLASACPRPWASPQDGIPYALRVQGKGGKERVVVLSPTAQRALHWSRTFGRNRGSRITPTSVEAGDGERRGSPWAAPPSAPPRSTSTSPASA